MRVMLKFDEFVTLMSTVDSHVGEDMKADRLLVKLQRVYQNVRGYRKHAMMILRMTKGPTNACINFHCDGLYASSTSQIALNSPSEYVGGQLCYFVDDKVEILTRPTGSLVQHPPRVLHGVTNLISGTRKSLFIVDDTNRGKGVGEVTKQHVESFLQSLGHKYSEST